MKEADVENLTIADVSPRIRSGEISPVELTDLFLDRIARLNPVINAYTTVLADSARAEAKSAEKEIRSGNYRSPLHGIPISIKDNLATSACARPADLKSWPIGSRTSMPRWWLN